MGTMRDDFNTDDRILNESPQLRDRIRFSHRDDWETFILEDY